MDKKGKTMDVNHSIEELYHVARSQLTGNKFILLYIERQFNFNLCCAKRKLLKKYKNIHLEFESDITLPIIGHI